MFSGLGDLVVRHSGRFFRREAKGGPCTNTSTRDKMTKVVRRRRRIFFRLETEVRNFILNYCITITERILGLVQTLTVKRTFSIFVY